MRRTALFLLCVAATASVATATIRRVPDEYPTIQAGIDAAAEGDTVLVGPGTYCENLQFRGVNIYLLSQSGPELTVIDGSWNGPVFTITSGEDTTTVIDGFTVTRGLHFRGGGFYIYQSHPKIVNNLIVENRALEYGGGINVEYGGVVVRNNIFHYNSCPNDLGGPGIHSITSELDISRNLFADQNGPADIFIRFGSHGTIINNTLSNSWLGISSHDYSPIYAINNIVYGMSDSGFRAADGGYLYCSYNCTFNNGEDYEGCSPGPGAVFADPLFVGGYPYDYHLREGSPCIDAGDPDSPPDPDGTRADIGVYYFPQELIVVTVTPDSTTVVRGGSLGYTVEVVNGTGEDRLLAYWSDLYLWDGDPYKGNPIFGPVFGTVKAGESKVGHLVHRVPEHAPLETYTLCGRIGDYPDVVWSEDCFEFEVVEGVAGTEGGPDWAVTESSF